jgi:hypothetical protein
MLDISRCVTGVSKGKIMGVMRTSADWPPNQCFAFFSSSVDLFELCGNFKEALDVGET